MTKVEVLALLLQRMVPKILLCPPTPSLSNPKYCRLAKKLNSKFGILPGGLRRTMSALSKLRLPASGPRCQRQNADFDVWAFSSSVPIGGDCQMVTVGYADAALVFYDR